VLSWFEKGEVETDVEAASDYIVKASGDYQFAPVFRLRDLEDHQVSFSTCKTRTRTAALSRATSSLTLRVARTIGQHNGTIPVTGKALSHEERLVHLHDYLRDRNLTRYYRIRLDEEGTIGWESDEKTRQWENEIDGKLVLETTNRTMEPEELVRQYKELQDVERCFRTLKGSLDSRPMHHWVDRRIEAHIFICVLALQI